MTTIPQRYRQTDGRTDSRLAIAHGNTALCVASCGKNAIRVVARLVMYMCNTRCSLVPTQHIEIYSGIARFLCNNTAFLFDCSER